MRILKPVPALVGLLTTIAFIPVNAYVGRLLFATRKELIARTDKRVKMITEVTPWGCRRRGEPWMMRGRWEWPGLRLGQGTWSLTGSHASPSAWPSFRCTPFPCCSHTTRSSAKPSQLLPECDDALLLQVLQGIKAIKLYAWEKPYLKR